jgi:hypothetical protein
MSQHYFQIGIRKLHTWPERQALYPLDEPSVRVTKFADAEHYHPVLKRRALELRDDPELSHTIFEGSKGGCGTKVRWIDRWGRIEADLVHARALSLFKQVYGLTGAVVDDSWASVYDKGDYCLPHSHHRSIASVLYMLDPGDQDPAELTGGKFCFADPRIAVCCQVEAGRMTQLLTPTLEEGSMMIFPSEWVHLVTPYTGSRPRITLSWNMHVRALPGKPEDPFK